MKRLLGLLFGLAWSYALGAHAQPLGQLCEKAIESRGPATAPESCPAGNEKVGLLCYASCPSGMRRAGVDCHSVCPAGLRDDGLFCRAEEYTRKSYGWEVGDHAIAWEDAWWNGIMTRCEAENGRGNCERGVGVGYPKCRPGYTAFVATCRPNPPDCTGLGLLGRIDLSCTKAVQVGVLVAASCARGREEIAGLCYPRCRPGWTKQDLSCRSPCPIGYGHACSGAHCGTTKEACESAPLHAVPSGSKWLACTLPPASVSVLDPAYYLSKYPDLKQAFGGDLEAARAHWAQNGVAEGRDASKTFSLGAYLARYEDLQEAFGTDYAAALNHWFTYGEDEERDARPEGTYMADPRAQVLDPVWYANRYADVKAAFGYKIPLLVKHWLEYGIAEGREPRANGASR